MTSQPRRLDWAQFRTTEFAAMDKEKTIVLFPTAAIEQHGPHLPVGVDTMINQGMIDALKAALPEDLNILVLPIAAVGKSNEHIHAAGTLTYSAETALRAWTEIGLSVARSGFRKMLIMNSHGGNLDLVSILHRELRVRAGMLAVKAQWGGFARMPELYSERERTFGIHGGDYETSLMLHFRPDCVDMSMAEDFVSTAESDPISPVGPVNYGWISRDLNPAGTVGEAHLATAEKGRQTTDAAVAGVIDLLRKMRDMPLDRFEPTWPALTL